jgi:GTP-binding protein
MYKLPFSLIPQVAFVGRSNVGKSSLINALLHNREIARPSPLPGRTRQLFTFDVGDAVSLVDLPGYGFAGKVGKDEREVWTEMIQIYLEKANGLERIVSLIDCRHGVKKLDEAFWRTVAESPIHPKRQNKAQVVITLTKTDLINAYELDRTIKATLSLMDHAKSIKGLRVWPYLHAVSVENGAGISELRAALTSMLPIDTPNSTSSPSLKEG